MSILHLISFPLSLWQVTGDGIGDYKKYYLVGGS